MKQDKFPWETQERETTILWPEPTTTYPSPWLALWGLVPFAVGVLVGYGAMFYVH